MSFSSRQMEEDCCMGLHLGWQVSLLHAVHQTLGSAVLWVTPSTNIPITCSFSDKFQCYLVYLGNLMALFLFLVKKMAVHVCYTLCCCFGLLHATCVFFCCVYCMRKIFLKDFLYHTIRIKLNVLLTIIIYITAVHIAFL